MVDEFIQESQIPTPGRPPNIISYAVWLYYRLNLNLNLSHWDFEHLLAEPSQESTRVRERGMRGPASRRFKSTRQAQRFVTAHAAVSNLFNLGRHKVGAQLYRDLRRRAFTELSRAVA